MELVKSKAVPLRALLTDCLPFEIPLEMSTHWLYRWFDQHLIGVNEATVSIRIASTLDALVAILADAKPPQGDDAASYLELSDRNPKRFEFSLENLRWHAPAHIRVRRDRNRTRSLDILAIGSQLALAHLYFRYSDVILYTLRGNQNSLRVPRSRAPVGRALRIRERSGHATARTATTRTTTRYFTSYFRYYRYSFMGEFFESNKWAALESRWQMMRRMDVSNCFPSLYTHSIQWFVGNEYMSKLHLGSGRGESTLGKCFDIVMQSSNWGETHGIPVGPEASRVFAEVVLGHVDVVIRRACNKGELPRQHYEFLRYMDDYFLFADEEQTLSTVEKAIEESLNELGLVVNPNKTKDFETPFSASVALNRENLKEYLASQLPKEGEFPRSDERSMRIRLKEVLLSADPSFDLTGSGLSQVERAVGSFLDGQVPKCTNSDQLKALLDHVWPFIESACAQYLERPSVPNATKIIRMIRRYYLAPALVQEGALDVGRATQQVREYARFTVRKTVSRLARVPYAGPEICYFLSLANACDISLNRDPSIRRELLKHLDGAMHARGDHSGLILALSMMKHETMVEASVSPDLLEKLDGIGDTLLASEYIPGPKIASHSAQELYLLAVLSCPFLAVEEKESLLSKPWVLELIGKQLLGGDQSDGKRKPMIRKLALEAEKSHSVLGFEWGEIDFDTAMVEKQPHFVY